MPGLCRHDFPTSLVGLRPSGTAFSTAIHPFCLYTTQASRPPSSDRCTMLEICFERVWIGAGAATAPQTLGMGEVLCRDCADMIFRPVWQVCDHLGLRFRQRLAYFASSSKAPPNHSWEMQRTVSERETPSRHGSRPDARD